MSKFLTTALGILIGACGGVALIWLFMVIVLADLT